MPELILASTSRYRRELLDRLRVPYRAQAPLIDERAAEPKGAPAEEKVRFLARAKAASLAQAFPDAHILGSDQGVDLDGELLGKPGTPMRAEEQLRLLAARSHTLLTAVALRAPDGRWTEHLDRHCMQLRALTAEEIARYVAADNPLDCAGSYRIEALGISLLERIGGEDFTAIVGLPLIAVGRMLRAAGFRTP